jgi:hypothetical protein
MRDLKGDPTNPILAPPVWSNIFYRKTQLREQLAAAVRRHLSPEETSVLVDYGCGTKPYAPLFAGYVGRYVGLDIDAAPTVDHVLRDDGRSDLPDAVADVVLSSQVLEHVPDPPLTCARLRGFCDRAVPFSSPRTAT